jgi:hypothetical protein
MDRSDLGISINMLIEYLKRKDANLKIPQKSKHPLIPVDLQLKWGLALLGKERSREYIRWLKSKIGIF